MQRLEVSGAVRRLYGSLGVRGLERGVILVMYVRPSTWNNLAPTGRIFVKFDF